MENLTTHYSDHQLEAILEEALIYMCACPAQVAEKLLRLRKLFAYQKNCLSKDGALKDVHQRIADSTGKAHAELEQCLQDVLRIEGWDLQTLKMPAGLRELRQKTIDEE